MKSLNDYQRPARIAVGNEGDFNGKFPLSSKDSDTFWQNIFPRESLDISKALL